jgi:hypothetical protein
MKVPSFAVIVSAAAFTAAHAQPQPSGEGPAPDKRMPSSAICTVGKAVTCAAEAGCSPATSVGEITLPLKVTVDFRHRVVMSVNKDGFPVASPISVFVSGEGKVILQGVDNDIGWTIHGSGTDKSMTFSMTSHDTVLSGFGSCEIEDED